MKFTDWGLVPYKNAMEMQIDLIEKIAKDQEEEQIIFCKHPSVVTLGRATEAGDLMGWQGDVVETQRGGRATYHGPEQLVIYPLINLQNRTKDLHLHLRKLENSLIDCLKEHYGISAEGGRKDATGVWIEEKKIASLGIAVRKWVTYHGMAVNLNHDPKAFTGISPCGFSTKTMVPLSQFTEEEISYESFKEQIKAFLLFVLLL